MYVYMSLNLYTCVHVHVQHVTDNAQHYKDLKVVLHGYDVPFCVYQTGLHKNSNLKVIPKFKYSTYMCCMAYYRDSTSIWLPIWLVQRLRSLSTCTHMCKCTMLNHEKVFPGMRATPYTGECTNTSLITSLNSMVKF